MKVRHSSLKASIQIEQKLDHPNKAPFEGTLFYVDTPSESAPSGTQGKKLYIPKDVAESALPSLVGMGVDRDYWLDDHDETNKIGIIEEAWIDGNAVKVKGYLFAKDFKDQVDEIREYQGSIGMSMETTETILEDFEYNGETVAKASSITFTGAAILYKWSAAYRNTNIAANADKEGDLFMDIKQVLDAIATVKTEITAAVDTKLTASIEQIKADLKKEVTEVAAGAQVTTEDLQKVVDSVAALTQAVEEIKAGKAPEGTEVNAGGGKPPEPPRRSQENLISKFGKEEVQAKAEGEETDLFASIDKQELDPINSMAQKLAAVYQK